jgi:preprotein translocase subunit SecE
VATKGKSAKGSPTTVVRVKAEDTRKKMKKEAPLKKNEVITADTSLPSKTKKERRNPLKAAGGYFKGAWQELRQVRWPNRKATWSMTAALLVFTGFFVALILLLDALFKYTFQLILGS